MQQDNDTNEPTFEWLKENKMKVLEWLNQSLGLNLIEIITSA